MREITIPVVSADRACDGCTICCDGWATGVAYDKRFYPGRKCHYVNDSGCTIYEDRPENPCKTFKCQWLTNYDIPAWMKPNRSDVLIAKESIQGIEFYTFKETGKKLNSSVLSWLVQAHLEGKIKNARYELEGGWNFLGDQRFLSLMLGSPPPTDAAKKQL